MDSEQLTDQGPYLFFAGYPLHTKPRPGILQGRHRSTCRYSPKVVRMVAVERQTKTTAPVSSEQSIARVGILGAGGYTGAELLRLLAGHPRTKITALTGTARSAGREMGDVYGQFAMGEFGSKLPKIVDTTSIDNWEQIADVVFCCLPHATTQEIISKMPMEKGVKVVDLSADFRLEDVETYKKWYGGEHLAKDLQKEAVYGLTELARDKVKSARLVANPGCYPTAAQLPLIPLLQKGLISKEDIIIDAKSGTTGAGRGAKVGTLFCEVADGIHAYGVASHRHAPEIEQGLSNAAGSDVYVTFTPHLMPMSRGILEAIYVKTENGVTVDDLHRCLSKQYENEPFVHVLPKGANPPQTRHVRGSNHCVMAVFEDRIKGRAIIVSVVDNLVKGASGQAIQNMNLIMGFPETMGLTLSPMFP
eukprot:Plantae.Rhodophyta-Hildenbrandia_rubra.ctg5973.p2 GENE.Plantae.Rhodophyta-Hildenbrandia_rubra.ctg5973~~Plantae.Rhodophyta-Hildenbrandia_rubra.ctg5973.p2  ORF type:complete len:419 (+),score=73.87 Plantae.Rhodophyta-Hildenbrandia_rubra.ctg5973:1981-3237(+)